MIEVLAQSTVEGIGIGAVGATVVAVVAVLVKRGFAVRVRVGDESGPSEAQVADPPAKPQYPCELHELFEKHLDERHTAVLAGLGEIRDSVERVHARIDEVVNRKS